MNLPNSIGFDLYFSSQDLKAGLLVSLLSVWVLVGVFYYLNRYTKRRYFSIWTVAWLFYALWLTLSLSQRPNAEIPFLLMLKQWCVSVAATFLLWGSLYFLGRRIRQRLLALFLVFLLVWSYIAVCQMQPPTESFGPLGVHRWLFQPQKMVWATVELQASVFGLLGLVSIFTAWGFFHYRQHRQYIGAGLLAFGFCFWGLFLAGFPFLQISKDLSSTGFFIAAVLQLFIAVSMIILVLEQLRYANQRRAQNEIKRHKQKQVVLQSMVVSTEERFRRLFEQSNEAILIAAAKDLRIMALNQAAERLLGVSGDEARRHSLTSFCQISLPRHHPPRTSSEWIHFLCEQNTLQMVRKDGRLVSTSLAAGSTNFEGEPAYQFSFHEITDQSRMQHQLVRAEKLSAVGQMVSGVTHELQNRLTGIQSFIELAMLDDDMSQQGQSDLEKALQECQRLGRMMRNFLTLSREHVNRQDMVDVNQTVREIVELRKFDLSAADIDWRMEMDPALGPTYADPDQIQQVLLNLINNAIHALIGSNRPGRLRISTKCDEGQIRIGIEDNGPGVPNELQSKIFEPFFTTKPAGIGTGLGLSIAHSIMLEHRGRLRYRTSDLGGAGFFMELPMTESPRAEMAGAAAQAAAMG